MRSTVTSVLRRSFNSKKGAQCFHVPSIISVKDVPKFEFEDCPFFAVTKNSDHSLPCFLVGRGIVRLFGKTYVFFEQIAFTVSLWCTRYLRIWEVALLLYCISSSMHKLAVSPEPLVTGHAGEFSSRQWGQHSPAKAPTTILSLRHSLQDLSVECAIDMIDPMGALSTAHANLPAVMRDSCRRTLYFFLILKISNALFIPVFLSTR